MPNVHYGILEAEYFDFLSGLEVVTGSGDINGYVQSTTNGASSMSTTVTGRPGLYDLVVYYFDENDGRATASVAVDGVALDSWTWNRDFGTGGATPASYTTRVVRNVRLDEAATITVSGRRDGEEPLRIDKIVLMPAEDRPLPAGLPAFEGAEGFGRMTTGGRGGWIVKVTNLNDSGVGSLRWALEELDVPRIVVFEVGGLITLESAINVKGDVTVAGQTAPGEGITIRGGKLQVIEDNVIIRGLKLRPGDGPGLEYNLRDGISIGHNLDLIRNVVIDSNSVSWATDEAISIWGNVSNVTISNNILGETLEGVYRDGSGAKGMLVGSPDINRDPQNITIIDNLFASNTYRNPTISGGNYIEVINNYVYNWEEHGLSVSTSRGDVIYLHAIGNVFDKGVMSGTQNAVRINGSGAGTRVYLLDNLSPDRTTDSQPERDIASGALSATLRNAPVFAGSGAQVIRSHDLRDHMLANVGARAQGVDAVDARILEYVENGGGAILKSQNQVGGYNVPTVRSTLADTDDDGIPDVFEARMGSNPLVFDPHGDVDRDGYSNIEDYINGLIAGDFVGPAPSRLAVEAEALQRVRGFTVETLPGASGGRVLRSGDGVDAEARLNFTNGAGLYDIAVRYFDENDGISRLAVRVDGVTIDEWLWNRNLGSALAVSGTLVERVLRDVQLAPGQVVSLVGVGNGGEPLRVDSLVFTPSALDGGDTGTPTDPPPPPPPAPVAVTIEAERMTLHQGFSVTSIPAASEVAGIQALGRVAARASTTLTSTEGRYDLGLRYFDESDGVASLAISLNGAVLDEWRWSRLTGSTAPTADSLFTRTVRGIDLAPGDVIELSGRGDFGEPLRIDNLVLTPVDLLV